MGAGARQEPLALGETPILAARLQNLAAPQTVVISAATYQLVEGWFTYQALGAHALKGFPESVPVYRILSESGAQNRLGMTRPTGLMPLVGREQELGLLLEWWAQVQEGMGQVVVLSGEAGIGKSRLVQEVQTHAAGESHTLLECRCSPYTQNSPLSSVIELFQRMLRFARDESPQEKLGKLEGFLAPYPVVLSEIVPLLAPLLSLPAPERYSPFTLTPQRQRQRTLEAVLAVLLALAAQRPPLLIMEDVHWADPSTLDLDLDPEGAEAVVKALEAEGQDALAVLADVSQPEATERMAQAAMARFGRIDGLINNAALFQRPAMSRVPFDRIPVPEWDRLMAVNLRGVFLCCRAVVPYMRQQRSGQIVNISSGTVFHGSPLAAHYVASKAGVIGLTRSLARELGEDNITVNAIAPGLTISMDEVSDARMTQNQQRIQARALKRTETPQDLVGTVVFLCSSESDFMTGQTLVVDGGAQMH
jgi:NAD(P)-dependent dehydrogenase (short-subunit alcohol dehydrogenase family)